MDFASRITRLPRAFEPDRGQEACAAVPWADGDIRGVIDGAAGSAPYLKVLIDKEGGWLEAAVAAPEDALDSESTRLRAVAPDQIGPELRRAKRRVALMTALADLAGVWPLEEVTGQLTRFADLAVQLALEAAIGQEIRRGKLPGQGPDDIAQAGGMVALAMGKMGAGELNYSSDIDLICLFDETRFDAEDYHEARASLVRATRRMAATLNDLTGEGYVFRTDLRLRPDPSVTPVCMAMEAAERYYESLGRTWERAAYIKARAAAGDIAAGERFLKTLTPFVWRKHLDFAAIQDAHDMRLRIRSHKGLHGPITLPGHNMKLGRGGIREIEFFTQTRQIIAGGRDPSLRVRGTVEGLTRLAERDWVPGDVSQTLIRHYRDHREVEHRIQMIADAQTHDLPKSDEGFARLACLMGTDTGALERALRDRLETVHELTERFFAPGGPSEAEAEEDLPEVLTESEIPARWPGYAALRTERAVEIFDRLQPEILRRLAGAARPEEALVAFDGFLAGLPAGVQVFSLFEANPPLIDLVIDITSVSPDLARYLARNASVFDAVIGGDFFADWPGMEALCAQLTALLAQEADYERQLDATRRWAKEWHFRLGVHLLRGLMDAEVAARGYADLAEAVLRGLWPVVQAEFARKHGPAPGRGAVVLGMGSLGAARLHARSDLDVIVIYDPLDAEMSEGKRPLPVRTYYARLTQALVTAMTAPMAEGRLYEIDMRLRPSGNQGPVATSWAAFQQYQRSEAWVWEHLALTRARVVAGPEDLAADVERFRTEVLRAPRARGAILAEVASMRARIAAAKTALSPWDPKLGPGHLQDVELVAQAAALLSDTKPRHAAAALEEAEWIAPEDRRALLQAYGTAWSLQIGARLISDGALEPDALGNSGRAFLCRLTGAADMDALASELDQTAQAAAASIARILSEGEAG
jgi:glutamate-ammonia-ligase adenylyltransferase